MSKRGSILHLGLGVLAVAGIALVGSSCVVKTQSSVACGAEVRPSIDCSSEISYQGYKADGGFGILNLASGKANFEDIAIRRISAETERFITAHTRLCRDYNACAIDKGKYDTEKKDILKLLEPVGTMVQAVQHAPNDGERRAALDTLYRHTVPANKRTEEVALRLLMEAELPPDAGGTHIVVRPGMPVPTEARAWFHVEVTPTAYVYIFQQTPSGGLTVLFPDERIGTKNPLTGDTKVRIPNDELKFRINEKDIGTEYVYFAASRKPLATLDAALARVREGKSTSIKDDKLLAHIEAASKSDRAKCRGLELDVPASGGGCTRTRGLELDVDAGFGKGASIGALTEPGDDLVVYSFSFEHTTADGYPNAHRRFETRKTGATRSGVIFERKTRSGVIFE